MFSPSGAQAEIPNDWKTFSHPAGIKFRYPGSWLVKEDASGIYVIPQPITMSPQGIPEEFMMFQSVAAEGITKPDDPRVAQFLDQLWTANFPGMQRNGKIGTVQTKLGPATVMTYEGQLPDGMNHRHKVFLTIHQDQGIFMVHLAPKNSKNGLAGTAQKIFTSLASTPPKIDSALLRSWSRSTTESSVGVGASVFANSTVTWTFKQDGTVLYESRSRVDGNTSDMGVSGYSDSGPGVTTGRFSAANGQLFIFWPNGNTERYQYKVFLHQGQPALKLVPFGENKAQYYQ
jgi:hypothetical protein